MSTAIRNTHTHTHARTHTHAHTRTHTHTDTHTHARAHVCVFVCVQAWRRVVKVMQANLSNKLYLWSSCIANF